MRPQSLVLRCYAEQETDGSWFAICLDLNLYARGDDAQEARGKLHDFIVHYVRTALSSDKEYIGDLLPRRAPIGFWAKWYYFRFLHWGGTQIKKLLYVEALPLKPA